MVSSSYEIRNPEDVVIVAALRTPLQRARRGTFKDTYPEELLSAALKGILEKTRINPSLIQDICVGTVLPPGGGATISRMAAFHAGYPETTCVQTLNRQCSSGLQAVMAIYAAIKADLIEIGIGAGMESMTHNYGPMAMPAGTSDLVSENKLAKDSLTPMGITSENIAKKFGITREMQDIFSAESHRKALSAAAKGLFSEEIIPVTVKVLDEHGATKEVRVAEDDGPRKTSVEALSNLKPAFISGEGTTTAGNSSQVTDGAAAVLLMKRKTAKKLHMPILGKIIAYSVVGVPPSIMGIGPAVAIPEVLKKTTLSIPDIDIFEINEAFASQAVYCIEKLGLDSAKVNPKGGAIALGHPLGCTGARQIATLLPELKRVNGRYGVVSMCIGTGMGAAAIIENESWSKSSL